MSADDPSRQGGRLTAGERSLLAQYAAMVSAAGADGRDLAVATAAEAARRCRRSVVAWEEIAKAMGITPAVLRDWRGTADTVAKPAAGDLPTGLAAPWPPTVASHPPAERRARMVLVAAGNAKVNGNDFAREAATIRHGLQPHGIAVVERFEIEIGELRCELDRLHPAVLHLAAHADFGAVHLSLGGSPSATLHADLSRVIRDAVTRPALVILSCCDTDGVARDLANPGPLTRTGVVRTAVGWRGSVTDSQAHAFAERFYPMLAAAHPVGACFDAPHRTVAAHWPDQAQPRLFGDASAIPLAVWL